MVLVLPKMIGFRVLVRIPIVTLLFLLFIAVRSLDLLIVYVGKFRFLCMHSRVLA